MISHVRIQNLRSLVDTGFVEIKPLTILLGSNSSGKSTFLRSFPLFTQSVNKPLREPISWFDDAYVDFGDYKTAKSKLTPDAEGIKFSYKIIGPFSLYDSMRHYGRSNQNILNDIFTILNGCEFELSFQKDSKGGIYVNGIEFRTHGLKVSFYITEKNGWVNIMVNDEPLVKELKWRWNYGPRNVLVPEFEYRRQPDDRFETIEQELEHLQIETIRQYCRKTLTNVEKLRPLISCWNIDRAKYLESLKEAHWLSTFKRHADLWDVPSREFSDIYNLIAVSRAISCFPVIDVELRQQYRNCSYVAPMRAAANRYYRTQGLQIRDVDPYGRNLPEFISSLTPYRKNEYEDFIQKVLGLKVTVENSNGHQSIILKGNNSDCNMTDVGFGYSQILPIITKLWNTKSNGYDRNSFYYGGYNREIITIEQPELHLHPAMQARTADIMMLTLNELKELERLRKERLSKRRPAEDILDFDFFTFAPSMIVETHSQAMINRIGKRIREKRFSADDVSILLFEKDEKTGMTNITPITYNEKGQLTNWPYGFFEPTDDDYDFLFDRQLKG